MENASHGIRLRTVEFSRTRIDDGMNLPLPIPALAEHSVQFDVDGPHSSTTKSLTTILHGRNGLGKSRILGGIATMFAQLESPNSTKPNTTLANRRTRPRWRIEYEIDGSNYCISGLAGQIGTSQIWADNGEPKVRTPNKIIALSSTVTDKFPVPKLLSNPIRTQNQNYVYMGLRDRTGRASAHVRVRQLLEMLLNSDLKNELRINQIEEIFNFLGYSMNISSYFGWRINFDEHYEQSSKSKDSPQTDKNLSSHADRQMNESDLKSKDLTTQSIANILEIFGRRSFRYTFTVDSANDPEKLSLESDLADLIHQGILRIRSIALERVSDGVKVELQELSSGELSIITTLVGLALTIENGSLILIDEPESSLHPEWQENYLNHLFNICRNYDGCHIIIATHSPLVISNTPEEGAEVISLEPGEQTNGSLSGSSADEVLIRAFGTPGNSNLYLKTLLVKALRLAADGEFDTARFDEITNILENIRKRLDPGDASVEIIQGLAEIKLTARGDSSNNA